MIETRCTRCHAHFQKIPMHHVCELEARGIFYYYVTYALGEAEGRNYGAYAFQVLMNYFPIGEITASLRKLHSGTPVVVLGWRKITQSELSNFVNYCGPPTAPRTPDGGHTAKIIPMTRPRK